MFTLKILTFLLVLAGSVVVFAARPIAKRLQLASKVRLDPHTTEGMDEAQLALYRERKAILQVKLYGLALATPGFILVLTVFRIQ